MKNDSRRRHIWPEGDASRSWVRDGNEMVDTGLLMWFYFSYKTVHVWCGVCGFTKDFCSDAIQLAYNMRVHSITEQPAGSCFFQCCPMNVPFLQFLSFVVCSFKGPSFIFNAIGPHLMEGVILFCFVWGCGPVGHH